MKKGYLILGLGRSGLSVISFCQKKNIPFQVFDDHNSSSYAGECLHDYNKIQWNEIEAVVQSPGISPKHKVTQIAYEKNIPVLTDLNLFCNELSLIQEKQPKFIGITGTNGKSTTTALIGHILKKEGLSVGVGGNIGVPVLSLLDQPICDYYVFELSSYQLELSAPIPLNVAVLLNLTEDHLERHNNMQGYKKAKERIFINAKSAVIGVDDHYSLSIFNEVNKNLPCYLVSINPSIEKINEEDVFSIYVKESNLHKGSEFISSLLSIPKLQGSHNHQNIAAAFGACEKLGLNKDKIIHHIQSFQGLAHRQEWVLERNNCVFVNDSKATNADSSEKALQTFKDDIIYWIAGGKPKTDGINSLTPYFHQIRKAYFIGQAREEFFNTAQSYLPCEMYETLQEALQAIRRQIEIDNTYCEFNHQRKVVLFSPACASFDQFKDFEHRGEVFKQLVLGYE